MLGHRGALHCMPGHESTPCKALSAGRIAAFGASARHHACHDVDGASSGAAAARRAAPVAASAASLERVVLDQHAGLHVAVGADDDPDEDGQHDGNQRQEAHDKAEEAGPAFAVQVHLQQQRHQ